MAEADQKFFSITAIIKSKTIREQPVSAVTKMESERRRSCYHFKVLDPTNNWNRCNKGHWTSSEKTPSYSGPVSQLKQLMASFTWCRLPAAQLCNPTLFGQTWAATISQWSWPIFTFSHYSLGWNQVRSEGLLQWSVTNLQLSFQLHTITGLWSVSIILLWWGTSVCDRVQSCQVTMARLRVKHVL